MSEFEKFSNDVSKVLVDYEKMKKEIRATLQEKMKGVFKAFFTTHPEVKTIHWTQYTPYFIDGDECVFCVHKPYFTKTAHQVVTEEGHTYGEEDEGTIADRVWDSELRKYVETEISPDLIKDMSALASFIQADPDLMQTMFGNHVWVKAHADGFEVDDYEHE